MNSHIQLDTKGNFLRYIPAGLAIEWDDNNYCTALALEKDGKSEQFKVYPLYDTAEPNCTESQGVRKVNPALVDNLWVQRWEIYDLGEDELAAKAAQEAATVHAKVEALWAAADKYTSSFISGVAVGILAIGVLQQKPKALAVSAWSSQVWAAYYERKALVTATSVDDLDFSAFGPIPYSVPELQQEVGL